jgi:protein Tex
VKDILAELEKPGRDPRPEFKTAVFREGVQQLRDLEPGMVLEGVVTNVTNFGAFVDVGVHQDGLVHVSQLADRFVADPREVVKAGDIVTVKVVDIDLKRRRIALTMKLQADGGAAGAGARPGPRLPRAQRPTDRGGAVARAEAPRAGARPEAPSTSMAAAFAKRQS